MNPRIFQRRPQVKPDARHASCAASRWPLAGILLLVQSVAIDVTAQTFPSKPIHLVTSFATGSSQDQIARIIAEPLRERLGQPVVVENKSGGGGILGSVHVAQSNPDGHTLVIAGVGEMALVPSTTPTLPYDPRRDFAPLSMLAELPFWIVASPEFPANTLGELIALARNQPGRLPFATYGPGTIGFFGVELLKQMAKIELLTVPYKSAAEAYPDVLSGRVPVFLDSVGASRGSVRAGKLKAIAVTTAARVTEYPDLVTVAEAGVPGYELQGFIGALAPASTPPAVVIRLSSELMEIMKLPAVRKRISDMALTPLGTNPEAFRERIDRDIEKFTLLVKATGVGVR